MRRIVVFAALLFLGGCQAAQVASTTFSPVAAQKSVYALKSGYAAVLTLAVVYNERARCGRPTSPVLCSEQVIVDQLRKADAAASVSIDAAENAVRSLSANPTVIEATIKGAESALGAFKAVTAIYAK